MEHLHGTSSLPWLAIGDFNEITSMIEKEGGSNRTRQQMKYFVDTINYCGLKEVRFTGPLFTWLYLKEDGSQIRERLDRALAMMEWFNLFPMAKLVHLSSSASDHSPLILQLFAKPRKKRMGRVFRFESMWLKDPRCEAIMEEAWDDGLLGGSDDVFNKCLENCRARLDVWNGTEFGNVGKTVAELQKKLEWLELQPSTLNMTRSLKNTRIELNYWMDKEDDMWRQRSRISWLQSGDRNTRFFNEKASARYKKNFIEVC